MWNYSEQDNQWQLTTADGKTLNVTGWDVTDANAAVIEGTGKRSLLEVRQPWLSDYCRR